jgi:hypothetical protein
MVKRLGLQQDPLPFYRLRGIIADDFSFVKLTDWWRFLTVPLSPQPNLP